MTSGKRGREEKSPSSKRAKNPRSSQETKLGKTRGAWASRKRKSNTAKEKGSTTLVREMPKDTMNEWLKKQRVIEKEVKPEITPPLDSTEEWLRKQVRERLSNEGQA